MRTPILAIYALLKMKTIFDLKILLKLVKLNGCVIKLSVEKKKKLLQLTAVKQFNSITIHHLQFIKISGTVNLYIS